MHQKFTKKIMNKLLTLLITIFSLVFASMNVSAAWLEKHPITVTQPDGTTIGLFVTGDEFHHRVHDEKGYTLLKNSEGWVVYAALLNDSLVPTNYIFGTIKPEYMGLKPNINISTSKKQELRNRFWRDVPQKPEPKFNTKSSTLRTGTLNNIVIYIKFPMTSFSHTKSEIEPLFTSTATGQSLYSYFRDISGGNFLVPSTFYPQSSTTILAYQAPNPRSYYEIDNSDETGRLIEHTLLRDAIEYCREQIEETFSASQLDYNNDGFVDNVCFVIQGNTGSWSTLLWPHRWALYSHTVSIHGKRVYDYNFIVENHLSSSKQSVLIHETYHTLGAPDLYVYPNNGLPQNNDLDPVGTWCIMNRNLNPPQSSTAYITNRYGKFIDNIQEISQTGIYTLYDVWDRSGNPTTYKITSPTSTEGEFFVLEYRRKNGGKTYESQIPNQGIVISRINPKVNGNASSNGTGEYPFGVYVYRQNGTYTNNGNLDSACFKSDGLTSFSDDSSPHAFLSNNSAGLGGIVVDHFSTAGDSTMTFRVTFPGTTVWEIGYPNAADVIAVLVNGTLTISGTGAMKDWGPGSNTPPWYSGVRNNITNVVIRNGVTNVGSYAFYRCGNLVSVAIPGSVTAIMAGAFAECTGLMSATIPNSVITIGDYAFSECGSLTSVTIPGSITDIGMNVFAECFNLTDVYVNRTTPLTVPSTTFQGVTTQNVRLHIPCDNNAYATAGVWKDFNVLQCWKIGEPNPSDIIATLNRNDSTLTINGAGAMMNWSDYTSVPWYNITDNITNIVINDSVTGIGNNAFAECTGLTNVYVNWSLPLLINSTVFYNVDVSNINLHVPSGIRCEYAFAFVWQDFNIIGQLPEIMAFAGSNGSISPNETETVNCGDDKTYTFTPNSGYKIYEVRIDYMNNPTAVSAGSYTFYNVTENHTIHVTFTPAAGINSETVHQISIYPNPVQTDLFIKSDLQIEKVEVYTLLGSPVISEHNFKDKISLSNLTSGIYLLKVYSDNDLTVCKIVKE